MTKWRVSAPKYNDEWEAELVARWEVSGDPISDNYTPDDISARDLFRLWADQVREEFADGLVPIYWSVRSPDAGKGAAMPFQHEHGEGRIKEDFLTEFDWPLDPQTGERLNWLTLPVVDKRWNAQRADKGGFIQEATGWKPSVLQPYVYLPALVEGTGL